LPVDFSATVYEVIIKAAIKEILLKGSYSVDAWSNSSEYSKDIAHFYKRELGSLMYTGTEILLRSLPIESLIMAQILNLVFGSLSHGSWSRSSNSPNLSYPSCSPSDDKLLICEGFYL
jgi:hypothetical protein